MPPIDRREIARAADRLEGAPASDIIRWAAERFGDGLVVASSFEDAVLIDLVDAAAGRIPVLFIDTGAHFPETLTFAKDLTARYDLDLRILTPVLSSDSPACGEDGCCAQRKVAPIRQELARHSAWITGLRRADSPTRATTPVVSWDEPMGVVKVAPLAHWSDTDLAEHVATRGLPEHPLRALGYRSIGCAPTTRPVAAGEDARAGRWPGQDKTECGLHT